MTTLSEAFRDDNPLHLHHVTPLDFDSVRTLPDSHVWPVSHELDSNRQFPLPSIDLKDPDAAKEIGQALETWGALEITNHGIPLSLLDEVDSETRRLFSLPASQKMKASRSAGGITGYGVAKIAPFFTKSMWHEGFTIMGSPIDHAKELWPHDYQRFCDVTEAYEKKAKELATTLMHLILKFLDITAEEMNWVHSPVGPSTALQLNSYPSCPDPSRAMGLAAHTDTSLFTIVHQSAASGLQIFKEGVGWGLVSPSCAEALVLNVGDLLHILSNARFPSVIHRVVMKEARQRYSVAYFYSPPINFHVSPTFSTNSGQSPRYLSVSVGEFIGMKKRNLEKALPMIRIKE